MARKIGSLLLISSLAVIILLLIQPAGQRTSTGPPTREALTSPADFVGWVLGVDPGSSQIHVESQVDKIVRPVSVKLTKDTMIFRRERGVLRQVDISEVYLQAQAELWLIGSVPSSFPAEVNARRVIVEKLP